MPKNIIKNITDNILLNGGKRQERHQNRKLTMPWRGGLVRQRREIGSAIKNVFFATLHSAVPLTVTPYL
jgi:hypothetical protein